MRPFGPITRPSRRAVLGAVAGTFCVWLVMGNVPALARRGRGRGGRDDDQHDDGGHERDDYERARRSLESGEALPLSTIIEEVKKVVDGEILDVELQRSDAGLIYQIKMLSRAGKYVLVWVHAKTKVIQRIQVQ